MLLVPKSSPYKNADELIAKIDTEAKAGPVEDVKPVPAGVPAPGETPAKQVERLQPSAAERQAGKSGSSWGGSLAHWAAHQAQ